MRLGPGLALLLLLWPGLLGAVNPQDGLVLGILGRWTDRGQVIHFGAVLTEQSQISCEEGGSLTVWFADVKKPAPIRCESPGKARRLSDLRPEESGVFSKLWQLVTPRIHEEPRTYIAAVSRGFGNAELEESVADVRAGRVDLSPALASAPAGEYGIVLLPTTETVPDSPAVTVEWQPGRPVRGSLPKAAPGLWKVAMAAPDGTLSSTAWILLVTPDGLPAVRRQFEEARALVADWPGGAHSQASRTVLRAFLETLSK